jgi:hypothetical protein
MPKFAVYFIPEKDDKFYQLGSSILGYDVRRKRKHETVHPELSESGPLKDEWFSSARPYGFHLTIGDAIDFEPGDIAKIEQALSNLLGCFDPAHKFILTQRKDEVIAIWNKETFVLRYDANDHLKILHALVSACINPLGNGSGYLVSYLRDRQDCESEPFRTNRILNFYSPTVFDSYRPHFTLVNPYTGHSHYELKLNLTSLFDEFSKIVIHSICLLVQLKDDENWQIYREYNLQHMDDVQ